MLLLAACAGHLGGQAMSAAAQSTPPPFDGPKKRLAVLRLENKVRTPIPDKSWQLGEGLTEMLVSELFKTGRFIMVERAALAEIVKEQELGQTGLIRKDTAAKVGAILGAEMLVTGAVTEFEAESSGGGGAIGYQAFAIQTQTKTAHVGVDIRMVDATTGEIVRSHNAEGKAEETAVAFAGQIKGVTFGSDAFLKMPIGQATRRAIQNAVAFIAQEMEAVPWTARVAGVKDGQIYVNQGANANLETCTNLTAYSLGEEVIDPRSGLSLGNERTYVGMVTLQEIHDKFSKGTFAGWGTLKRGDLLIMGQPPSAAAHARVMPSGDGWLGIEVIQAREYRGIKKPGGLECHPMIVRMAPVGPAEKGGLKQGDIITAINETEIPSSLALVQVSRAIPPGKSVPVKVFREGKTVTFPVAIGDQRAYPKLVREAAEQGDPRAQDALGDAHRTGSWKDKGVPRNEPEAVKWYRKAAEQGYARGQTNLGWMYSDGLGVQQDYTEALKWYRKAAEQGHDAGQVHLGFMYENGHGLSQDHAEAVKWYRKAAEQGYPGGQFKLGTMYGDGLGVQQDYTEALKWYRKAAEQGFGPAQTNVGVFYHNGWGVARNYAEAVRWYRKAAAQGEKAAQQNLDSLRAAGVISR